MFKFLPLVKVIEKTLTSTYTVLQEVLLILDQLSLDNRITGVQILDGGIGYRSSDTTLDLRNRGKSAKFIANVREWKINQVQKNENIIKYEDSILTKPSTNPEYQLQTIGMYPPQKLRYQLGDNIDSGNLETPNAFHSPILGFAYDGNPIYGPYGYQNPDWWCYQKITVWVYS